MTDLHAVSNAIARPTADLAGKYLAFVLDHNEFGVGILAVREIIAAQEITPLPQMPAYVLGVFNLRGRIIPVVDLRARLELTCAPFSNETCIIVVEIATPSGESTPVGFVVDTVREVLDIPESSLEKPPRWGAEASAEWMLGLAKIGAPHKVVTLLDVQVLLGSIGTHMAASSPARE